MSDSEIFDCEEFLARWAGSLQPAIKALADEFLTGRAPRYALGRSETSLLLAQAIPLSGILDDHSTDSTWEGLPILKEDDLKTNGIVVNTVVVARPVSASRRLRGLPKQRSINYADLMLAHPDTFPPPKFVKETRDSLRTNPLAFKNLYSFLKDDESRKVFDDVFRYRMTASPSFMLDYTCREKEQYFESFFNFPVGGVFIDAGGYDGQTSIEFSKRYPHYGAIHVFEPSQKNLAILNASLKNIRNTTIHPLGLSEKHDTLNFSGEGGSSSKIIETGGERIEVDRLDSILGKETKNEARADLIKMDLEGWELSALTGSHSTILKNHPILAIGAYHHPLDFIRIHEYVFSLRSDYDVYLRHYTEGWTETVMYFVPVGRAE